MFAALIEFDFTLLFNCSFGDFQNIKSIPKLSCFNSLSLIKCCDKLVLFGLIWKHCKLFVFNTDTH